MTENAYGRAPLLAAAQGTQPTLLHYALSTIPNPIQADRSASISISVTNPTNAAIDLQELKINLQNGRFPQDLSDGFSNVVTKASPGWTFGPSSSPGIFTVKPQTPQDGNITANSVVFVISSIPVNDQPGGPVPFVLTETTGPNGRVGNLTVGVNKAPPDFFLENVYGTPNLIDYDGSGTVHWKATPGATITLDFDGQVHRHVKGHPGDPLPATGSYSFDNLTTDKTVTVIANNPGSGSPRTLRKQVQLQLSVARIETLTATVSATPGTLPHVDIDWSAASATSATLSNSLAAVYRFVDPHSGTFQTPIAVQTDFTLSAENPAYPAPSHATVTATPPAMGWTKVNGGPSEPHFVQALPNGLLSISVVSAAFSENGMDWIDVAFPIAQIGGQGGNPPQQLEQPIGTTVRNNAAITMTRNMAVTGPAPHARQIMLTSSTDLETWTQPPTAPWATSIFPDASIVTAPTGDVFVFGATSTQNEVWCSKDGLKTWTKLASKVCGPPCFSPSMAWFAGKIWLIGGRDAQSTQLYHVWSSPDGITWTQENNPNWEGLPSPNPQVFRGKLCLFMASSPVFKKKLPLALWQMDATGAWAQDPAIPNGYALPTGPIGGIAIAVYKDTLFASFNSNTSLSGIWMRNT